MIDWFAKELLELQSSPLVTLRIHSTRNSSASSLNIPICRLSSDSLPLQDIEKSSLPASETTSPVTLRNSLEPDREKHPEGANTLPRRTLSVQSGRPDVANIIYSLVETSAKHDRIAVAACGPNSLMKVTRKTVARCIRPDGPSLELHCEQFGW
jgi:hypothetical protein